MGELLKQNQKLLAETITWEHGKSVADSMGDVFRGYEVAEHACSFNSLMQGETMGNVATGIDIQSYRVPLGVCAGFTPWPSPPETPSSLSPPSVPPTPPSSSSTSSAKPASLRESSTASRVASRPSTTSALTKMSVPSPSSEPTPPESTFTRNALKPESVPRSTWVPRTPIASPWACPPLCLRSSEQVSSEQSK